MKCRFRDRPPGATSLALLAQNEGSDAGDGIQIFGHHLGVLDLDAEGGLHEGDDLKDAGRIDEATIQKRGFVFQCRGILNVEIADDELPDLLPRGFHAPASMSTTAGNGYLKNAARLPLAGAQHPGLPFGIGHDADVLVSAGTLEKALNLTFLSKADLEQQRGA